MDIFSVLTLFGGLALFLYGMNVMGGALEKLAGSRLERILERLTDNPIKGVLLGFGVTARRRRQSWSLVLSMRGS